MADWRNELNSMMGGKTGGTRAEHENAVFEAFLDEVAVPALNEIAEEFVAHHGREAVVRRAPASATLSVRKADAEEITFRIMKHFVQSGILPRAEVRINRGTRFVKHESMFKEGTQNYPIGDVVKEDVIACFLRYYRMLMNPNQPGALE